MIIAIQRAIGTSSMSMIVAEDWRRLKIRMCEQWLVEKPFDRHLVWDRLRDDQIVTYQGDMYQVYEPDHQGDWVDELFQGRHIEVLDEES